MRNTVCKRKMAMPPAALPPAPVPAVHRMMPAPSIMRMVHPGIARRGHCVSRPYVDRRRPDNHRRRRASSRHTHQAKHNEQSHGGIIRIGPNTCLCNGRSPPAPMPSVARMARPDIPRPWHGVCRFHNNDGIPPPVPPVARMMPAPAVARMAHPDIPRPWHRVGRPGIDGDGHGPGQRRSGRDPRRRHGQTHRNGNLFHEDTPLSFYSAGQRRMFFPPGCVWQALFTDWPSRRHIPAPANNLGFSLGRPAIRRAGHGLPASLP